MAGKLTIITPLWCDTENKRNWFSECVESVCSQPFENWEWIVIDDFSPLSVEIPDSRIRLLKNKKLGPAACRNRAVEEADTDWILPLDSDDVLAADALNLLWNRRDEKKFVYGDVKYLNGGTIKLPEYSFEDSLKFLTGPVTALHHRKLWEAVGGWKVEFDAGLEDVEYWISAGAKGFCGYKIDGLTLLYRKHTGSRTARMRKVRRQGEMQRKIQEYHRPLYEGQRPEGCCGKVPERQAVFRSGTLDAPGPKVWVTYTGKRNDAFHVRGRSGLLYQIFGRGQKFQVLADDAQSFRLLGRGKDFAVG